MKKKIVGLILVVLALISLLVFKLTDIQKKHQVKESKPQEHLVKAGSIKLTKLLGEHQEFVLTNGLELTGDQYLIGFDSVTKEDRSYYPDELTTLYYYDIEHNFTRKSVNLRQKIKTIKKNAYFSSYARPDTRMMSEAKEYKNTLDLYYTWPSSKKWIREKRLLFNLDSGKFYDVDDADSLEIYHLEENSILFDTNFLIKLKELGYKYNTYENSIAIDKSKHRASSDINLIVDYPELKNTLLKDDDYKLYIRESKFTPEEFYELAIRLFAKKGSNYLSGIKIKKEYSIDGKEHEVHSYAELEQLHKGR